MYENFITLFEAKLKQLSFAQICALIAKQYTEVDKAIAFMENVAEKKGRLGDEAWSYCQSITAWCAALSSHRFANQLFVCVRAASS